MRVLLVNTSETSGGAAIASNRLLHALNNHGVKANLLVMEKKTDALNVLEIPGKWKKRWHFLFERLSIFVHLRFSKRHLFHVDVANCGTDITRLSAFKEADVIHLHWINQGMLSLNAIRKILDSGKPVVWTMHDIWPAVGICHLALDCVQFHTICGHCRFLPDSGADHDLSTKVWKKKKASYVNRGISFVACSRWLADESRKSSLIGEENISSVPNPINTSIYRPKNKIQARNALSLPQDKHLILFIAQKATNVYKGIEYLIEACHLLVDQHPEMKSTTALAILGIGADELRDRFPIPSYPLGYVEDKEKMVEIYNSANVFVLPSLSENLPNTVMEAMACGIPCVTFRVGGIPEEISHLKNGYLAQYKDAQDLADGIHWVLEKGDYPSLKKEAIRKVVSEYSESRVALQYIDVYQRAIELKEKEHD